MSHSMEGQPLLHWACNIILFLTFFFIAIAAKNRHLGQSSSGSRLEVCRAHAASPKQFPQIPVLAEDAIPPCSEAVMLAQSELLQE